MVFARREGEGGGEVTVPCYYLAQYCSALRNVERRNAPMLYAYAPHIKFQFHRSTLRRTASYRVAPHRTASRHIVSRVRLAFVPVSHSKLTRCSYCHRTAGRTRSRVTHGTTEAPSWPTLLGREMATAWRCLLECCNAALEAPAPGASMGTAWRSLVGKPREPVAEGGDTRTRPGFSGRSIYQARRQTR